MSEFSTLYIAHKLARRGKQGKREVVLFEMRMCENIERLKYHLRAGTYKVGKYREFTIYDPKKRNIQALSYIDRIVQHSLCDNILGPYLDKRLIYDNAACRIGNGTHFAMDRLTKFMREYYKKYGSEGYILKCDIRKYFDSIYHPVLKDKISKMKLPEDIKALLYMIVDSYECTPERGLPMGNQTSQWFALYYLDGLDRQVKEQLGVKYYTRYMDDIIILHPDKESIKKILVAMTEYVEGELKLEFNEKTQIHHIRQGVQYLGFRFYLTENGKVIRLLRAQNKRKLRKRITKFGKMISNDQIDYTNLHNSLVSTRGHLLHGNTYNLRTRYFTELDNIIYTHDMEKADMQIAYLIETNNKPIQGGRA